jgi:hypothetical protein
MVDRLIGQRSGQEGWKSGSQEKLSMVNEGKTVMTFHATSTSMCGVTLAIMLSYNLCVMPLQ